MLFVGTYTRGTQSRGVYSYTLDPKTGKLSLLTATGGLDNPGYLALHPSRQLLYATEETGDFGPNKTGSIAALAIEPSGALRLLNRVTSGGTYPCHLTLDRTGRTLTSANYGDGAITLSPIRSDGSLADPTSTQKPTGKSINPDRQEGPHGHGVYVSATNRYLLAADLGLDKINVYRLDPARGTLTPHDPPSGDLLPGSGPRHLALHPRRPFVYAINEMASTITGFRWDEKTGRLTRLDTVSTLPAGYKGDTSTAEIFFHPSGKFLYGSNRGHDSIAVFAVDDRTGRLSVRDITPSRVATPRGFAIDPTGAYLVAAGQTSNNLAVFRINPQTGKLTPTGPLTDCPAPVCIVFGR